MAAQLSSSSGSSLSLSPERVETTELAEDMEKATVEETVACTMFSPPDLGPPPFNLDTDFPMARAGGLPCGGSTPRMLQTNHFPLSLKFPGGMIYQYSVTIMPP